jgi:hypothetical protein
MNNPKPFLSQTAETAAFAFREYFRPLVAPFHFLKSIRTPSKRPEAPPEALSDRPPEGRISLKDAKAMLSERLAKDRRHGQMLLMQGLIAAFASLLALSISLMRAFDVRLTVILAVILPASTVGVWMALRIIRNREEIIELKTIRWVMKAVDDETAAQVARQVLWGKPERERQSRPDKAPH